MVTPEPLINGIQTAVVVGPQGEEIHTDEYGRIKVRFYWDREKKPSCWVRVAQVWSGKKWGGQYIPRIGMEVVVEFLEGDPDRPLVIGTVYNADYMPPYELPANKTQSRPQVEFVEGRRWLQRASVRRQEGLREDPLACREGSRGGDCPQRDA